MSPSSTAKTPTPPKSTDDEDTWVDDGERNEIPQPPKKWILGNITDIDPVNTVVSLRRLTKLYGPIFKLRLISDTVFISSQKLVHFVSNEDKFEKVLSSPLVQVRNFAGDGLFTAFSGEHNWTLAHRILIPAFGPLAIKKMQGMMLEMISQMLVSWEAHSGTPFEAADQFTRLTFDTIGWCAFRYRFNSFFSAEMHPFVDIMVDLLTESGLRSRRPDLVSSLMFTNEANYRAQIKELHRQCDEIVATRRRNPDPDAHDLLNNMIFDKDPKTGEKLSDDNIRYQMVTFLIAGHETTSGMLSFATYYMLRNPRTFMKARTEADKVISEAGGNLLKINPASLQYIDAICKETLRLQPTAPAWTVAAKDKDGAVLPGGYHVDQGETIAVLLHELHRDQSVWGPDAEDFRPERFLESTPAKDSFKPFGNGSRACIGRGFAMQEALLALALIVNRFDLEMADPSYDLEIRESLTVKPDNFQIIARPRKGQHQSLLTELIAGGTTGLAPDPKVKTEDAASNPAAPAGSAGNLYILYGSNSGSCEGLANEIASEGSAKGFAVTLSDLDSIASGGKLPTDGPVVICTASYEGKPTDNARMFVGAIESTEDETLAKGVKYCIMGAGHHDWASTFHKIPSYIDKRLSELGGERFMDLHLGDAGGDLVGDFDDFKAALWDHFGVSDVQAAGKAAQAAPAVDDGKDDKSDVPVRVLPRTANAVASIIKTGTDALGSIVSQEVLVEAAADHPQTNSLTVNLPSGQTFRAGDYLAVLPQNPQVVIDRALSHFEIKADDRVVLNLPGSSFLPSNIPVIASDVIGQYVEIGQPISKRLLPKLAEFCTDAKEKEQLKALEENYQAEVFDKRESLLDILEKFKSCKVSFDFFLANLPKMKIRQYSISSTPLATPQQVKLTFTVHTVRDTDGKSYPAGVASNYLAFLKEGDSVACSVKASSEFHPPQEPSTPIVMFAAGSGFAPFRGFIEERALQKESGRQIGTTVLYYGCRSEADMVHKDELGKWVKAGVLDLRPVFSRSKETEIAAMKDVKGIQIIPDCKYVQDRVWKERTSVCDLFEKGAQFYTCGSGAKLGKDLKKTLVDIIKDVEPDDDAEKLYEKLAKDRYRTDVFL